MSLLLNGAKTMTIAGTEMQCLEIYTGEAYTLPLSFTDANGNAVNITGWTLSTTAKFYTVDNVLYTSDTEVNVGNLTLITPQPNTGAGTYSANLTVANTTPASGSGYLYIPADITGNTNGDGTPVISLANNAANSTLIIVTLRIQRTDVLSSKTDINREPLGFIVRYQ